MTPTQQIGTVALFLFSCTSLVSAQSPADNQPDYVRQGKLLVAEGKPDDALALYQAILKSTPDALPANTAAGSLLDWMGRGDQARVHFQHAIDAAPDSKTKATAQRSMAMSWAFSGDCKQTIKYEQMVFQYYATQKDFNAEGEIANEGARVCLDNGDFDTAYQWYLTGHDAGLKQPDLTPDKKNLWAFRWEHAQARIAARRGNQTEADRHVEAARAILEHDPVTAKAQAAFLPYLIGYVAFHRGDYQNALAQLNKANVDDPYIQCLIGETLEKLAQPAKARDLYVKAAATMAHNPAGAYAVPHSRRRLAVLTSLEKPAQQ